MKVKKYFKAVCMALVFCFLVSYTMLVANVQAAEARTIIKYARAGVSEKGLFQVYVSMSVQDSVEQIIGYHIDDIIPAYNTITDVEIISQGLDKNNTRVYVHLSFLFNGSRCVDSVYIDM